MSLNDSVANFDASGSPDENDENATTNDDGNAVPAPSANPASDGTDTEVVVPKDEYPKTEVAEKPKHTTVDVDFVIAQSLDERRSIPGTSQYLDEVERRNAEITRAKAEDREPDLDNPPATQGTPLYTEAQAKQQGLNVDGEAVQRVTLPVVITEAETNAEEGLTYDAFNGAGASALVNTGRPV